MPTPCPHADDGKHAWKQVGTCYHTSAGAYVAGNDYIAYECERCGRVGHSAPRSFACGMRKWRRDEAQQRQARIDAENEQCPIYARLLAQMAPGAQP